MNSMMRKELDQSVLCWLATASPDGMPNVSPKEIFTGYGRDGIVIADIASPMSVRNIRVNPKVCVSFIDIFRQRGFKVAGMARIIDPDQGDFQRYGFGLIAKAGDAFAIRHVIVVTIQHIARIQAPSYLLFPGRSDEEVMRETYLAYGVQKI